MADKNSNNPTTKRQQIDNTRQQMFIVTALAAGAIVLCVMVGWNLINRIIYQNKVNGELDKTSQIMQANVNSINSLIANIDNLKADKNLNLDNLKNGEESAIQVILDSLPTDDNRLILSASLKDKILDKSGAHIDSIAVTQNGDSTTDSTTTVAQSNVTATSSSSTIYPTAQKIPFSTSFSGSESLIKQTLEVMENSIRPIHVESLSISINDTGDSASVNASTFYSPAVQYKLGSTTVTSDTNSERSSE